MKRRIKTQFGYRARQMLLILLLIAFLALMVIFEIRRSEADVGRERVHLSAYTYSDSLVGYVFREEAEVTDGGNNGPVEYLAYHGSSVSSKEPLVITYAEAGGEGERARAAELFAEIERLERSLAEENWQKSYMSSYAAMMSAVSAGEWHSGVDAASALATALSQSSVATVEGSKEAVQARIAELRAEVSDMVKWAKDTAVTVSAPTDGYFCTETDGYEGLFSLPNAANVTPASLSLWLEHHEPAVGAVGKVVGRGTFYLAVPVTAEEAAQYVSGLTYRVRMVRGGEAEMLLERISTDQTGSLLVLRADAMPEGMDFARRQPIVVGRETVSGLCVPATALQTEGDETFVFVAENGVAHRRRVAVLCAEQGCCIVALRQEEGFLREGEQLLITSRSMYEGKALRK